MKQILGIILICLIQFSFSSPRTIGEQASANINSLEDGLIAHYDFNDCDAKDITGNDSDGVLFGGVTCWCGIEDDGLLLDGLNDYVEFQGNVNKYFTTSDFTISFFIRTDQYSFFQQSLFSKREECDEENVLDFLLDRNKKSINTFVQESEFKSYKDISPEILDGGWYHVTLVREGREARTYINGQLQKTATRCSGVDLSNGAVLSFSNTPCLDGTTRRFKGILDEVRVYERALLDKEIEAIYLLTPIERVKSDCYS